MRSSSGSLRFSSTDKARATTAPATDSCQYRITTPSLSGARNAGRVAGWRVAAAVFALDLAKGALAVAIGRLAGLDEGWLSVSLVAVVAGHVLPVQLRFRGGRGLSTALGAMLVLNPAAALIGLVTAVVVALGARQVTVAGLAGMTAAPAAALLLGVRGYELAGLTATTVLVLAAHARRT